MAYRHRCNVQRLLTITIIPMVIGMVIYIHGQKLLITKTTVYQNIENDDVKEKEIEHFGNERKMGHFGDKMNKTFTSSKREIKTILWYKSDQMWVQMLLQGKSVKLFENCPIKECRISFQRKDFNKSDAVIFDGFTLPERATKSKPRDQIWILYHNDSPMTYRVTDRYHLCKEKFNWTLSYRRDADFYFNMGRFETLEQKNNMNFTNIVNGKSKLVAIVVSNCHTHSKRHEFIQELKKHVAVDIYGRCGPLKCDNNNRFEHLQDAWSFRPKENGDCFKKIENVYKFYLSFENSFCKDYLTEKSLHRILERNIIPVVRGGAEYSIYHPPHSSINVMDFEKPTDLASYLLHLDKNDNEYMQYLQWKQFYRTENVVPVFKEALCNICKGIHNPKRYARIYDDIHAWAFSPADQSVCWI